MKAHDYSLEQYSAMIATPTFWDILENSGMMTDEKLVHLGAFLKMGGSLLNVIEEYCGKCDQSQKAAIQWCIVEYLSALLPGGVIDPRTDIMDRIKRLDRESLVQVLECEIAAKVKEGRPGFWSVLQAKSHELPSLNGQHLQDELIAYWISGGSGLWES